MAILQDLIGKVSCRFRRNGKAETLDAGFAGAGAHFGGIDADHLTIFVDQRAAGIAFI